MSGPDPAVAGIRSAVRAFLDGAECSSLLESGQLCVAVSGGADSLALSEAAAHVGRRRGLRVRVLVVDHGLQDGSAEVARTAAEQALKLGAHDAEVLGAHVGRRGGPEAAARAARYTALRAALPTAETLVLLGHTRDDQAETVLLGLGRGSGARSLAGMRSLDPPWGRPLLEVPRSRTREACRALGVRPWEDPHNTDSRFTRVRLRHEVLPLLDEVLSGGVFGALSRTAVQLREDDEALDELAGALLDRALASGDEPGDDISDETGDETSHELIVAELETAAPAVRRRCLRRWLLTGGVAEVTDPQLRAVDALIGAWRGQGAVWLPGDYSVRRRHDRLRLQPPE